MDRPDYPQDEKPETPNSVPALIHDYRAQREAWREQARNLARMREEVLAAADREARDIVSVARADVRRILLKARRDLLVLAAQVRAAGRLGEAEDTPDTVNFLPADDLGQVSDALTTARHDVRRVLDETRPELEGLAAEGEALRAALRPQRPGAASEFPRQVASRAVPVLDVTAERTVDFEFTSVATDDPEEPFVPLGLSRQLRAFLVAAASFGAIAVMGTAWWVFRSPGESHAAVPVRSATSADSKPGSGSKVPGAFDATPARARTTDARLPGMPIDVTASRTSWVRVTVDGRVAVERTFKAGESQQFRGSREVSVRAGDAGAVAVAIDGRRPVTLGDEGEVITRRFPLESPPLRTPAPGPTRPNPSMPVAQSVPAARPSAPLAQSSLPGVQSSPRPSAGQPSPASTAPASANAGRAVNLPVATPPAAPAPSPAVPLATATGGARPATASIDRPALAPPSASTSSMSLQDRFTSDAGRWLDANYRQDRASMAAISGAQVNISDDRSEKERLPRGLNGVRRSLDGVNVQVFGSEAMLTAKMTERMEDPVAGKGNQAVSYVSLMWTQRNGVWQLHDVKLVSAAALSGSLAR